MEYLESINDFVNGIVWGVPMLILILAVGIFFTVRLDFLQFRFFGRMLRKTAGRVRDNGEDGASGEVSSFQAAMTSVSAIVGSGNIAGVATALVCGGPGALFWMIVAALIGMATKFAEICLGMLWRRQSPDGSMQGGAMYYLADGLGKKWLGVLFSFLVIPFAFVISAVVDTNTIATAVNEQFGVSPLVVGVALAVICALVIFGGSRRVGRACELVAPFMGGAYILAGLLVIFLNLSLLPSALVQIVEGAFAPRAVTGGAVGSVFVCMRYGIARGVYSNEAGLGTAAMVHSGAKVSHPAEQAIWGPVEVFFDTIIVCSITALTIVMSGLWADGRFDGAALTMRAFEKMLPGQFGLYICLGSVVLFGFSCLISYYVYAERAAVYIFGERCRPVVKLLWIVFILVGSVTTLGFAWDLADTFNGLMIIPNLIGIVLLSGQVVSAWNEYRDRL